MVDRQSGVTRLLSLPAVGGAALAAVWRADGPEVGEGQGAVAVGRRR